MTKEEFEVLKLEHSQSGKTLKDFLKEKGINYGTYHYWLKKKENEESTGELAPIHFTEEKREQTASSMDIRHQGVSLLFPNGLQAHFGAGSESMLKELFDKSLDGHVLPQ